MLIKDQCHIKNLTSFKIGGVIDRVYLPESENDLTNLPKDSVVIGNLSNTLVSSFGVSVPIVSTTKLDRIEILRQEKANEAMVIAQAGVKGPKLAQITADSGLSGLEFMIGFPGTVGGEVCMNAGAHGNCVADCLQSAKVFDGKSLKELSNDNMNFSYRHSVCQDENYIVLQASFLLKESNPQDIKQKISEYLEFRKQHQPSLVLPNCGSVFKNPKNNSAGKLLDECGVKGLQVGGARVWDGHANFIVNTGDATSIDVLNLMCEMKRKVFDKFNIELEPEIKFVGGNNDEEVELCKYLKVK